MDCWSLGVLLYTLVYGAMPFDGSNFKRLVKQISAGDYYEPKKPSNASTLIREMLTVCPKQRATIEQICNHWWVNESHQESCLDLAEELANQTPVRLDVLLSLAPTAVTSDQLVVPTPMDEIVPSVARSHSVGSICDMGNTEAERRIIDMVTAGGEAALAPSPTRNIALPAENAAQSKRKLDTTISMEAVIGGSIAGNRKREKPDDLSISEVIDVDPKISSTNLNESAEAREANNDNSQDRLIRDISSSTLPDVEYEKQVIDRVEEKTPKSTAAFIEEVTVESCVSGAELTQPSSIDAAPMPERQNSLPDDETQKSNTERRRSRIFETAGKFETNNNTHGTSTFEKKKIVIPGVSVGNFRKEFERKASLTSLPSPLPVGITEKRLLINSDSVEDAEPVVGERKNSLAVAATPAAIGADETPKEMPQEISRIASNTSAGTVALAQSDSKSSTFSLEEARRSMENSIALLNQARTESGSDVEQLCAKTEAVAVSPTESYERQKKLQNAREIIGNAIPVGKIGGMGKCYCCHSFRLLHRWEHQNH